jgi:hypothetical protein
MFFLARLDEEEERLALYFFRIKINVIILYEESIPLARDEANNDILQL